MSLYKSVFLAEKQHASGIIPETRDPEYQKRKEVQRNAQNLSTQKASEKERARLQKENEDRWRKKRSQETPRKR